MGMHFGIIAARLPWNDFLPEISRDYGEFLDQGEVVDPEDAHLEANDTGWRILGGELAGSSYVLDTSFILSDACDSLQRISKDRGTTLIGCGAETVSGTFWLFVAQNGAILRRYHSCHSGLRERLDSGDPLPPEKKTSLEDIDGGGLLAVLKHFGFDYDRWYREGHRRVYQFTDEKQSEQGPLARELAAHFEKYKLQPSERPPIQLSIRSAAEGKRPGCLGMFLGLW